MRPSLRPPRSFAIAAALLATLFAELFFASRLKSPAWDEPGHIASGVAYVQLGSLAVNPQHPPLLKALSGLSLTIAGAKWPDVAQARELLNGAEKWQWDIGSLMLIKAGVDRALQWARLPMMLVGVLGGLVIYLWGRQLAGELAGLCALFLYALDPTIVGHSFLVTLDVGLGVFSLLFLFCLRTYVRVPGRLMLAICGVTLGLALCTKFSSVVLLPVGAVLLALGSQEPLRARAASLAWIGGIAAMVVLGIYRFHDAGAFLAGITRVNADHDANYLAFMAGRLAGNFTSYFAVAYLLKEPLAGIALAAGGVWVVLRGSLGRSDGARTAAGGPAKVARREKAFVLLPPVAFFALHVWKADDLGIRYIVPCLPFAHLLGGIALATLVRAPGPALRVAAAVLSVWIVAAAAGIYPDGLSYFNESACLMDNPAKIGLDGGSRCGIAWLDDSNVDWGEGLKQLGVWIDRNAKSRLARLAYFGSFPPQAYDLPLELMDDSQTWFRPPPGLYAVSAHLVAHNTALVRGAWSRGDEWMARLTPRAIVGHCLYIYDISGKE
jgi:hypothetical protein